MDRQVPREPQADPAAVETVLDVSRRVISPGAEAGEPTAAQRAVAEAFRDLAAAAGEVPVGRRPQPAQAGAPVPRPRPAARPGGPVPRVPPIRPRARERRP